MTIHVSAMLAIHKRHPATINAALMKDLLKLA